VRDVAAKQILAELARRRPVVADSQRNAAVATAALLRAFYYPGQGAFFRSKKRRKATKKTRRAGATTGGVRECLARCLEQPNYRAVVVHSTKQEARDRAWMSDTKSGFVDILRELGSPLEDPSLEVIMLGGVRIEVRDQVMQLDFNNGSQVKLFGYDDLRALRKQRGLAKHLYWIDEAQDIRFLDEFYNKVILAQQDFDCEVWLTGTPGQDCAGMFYEITREEEAERTPEWEVHTLTQVENPFFGCVITDSTGGPMVYHVEDNLKERTGPFTTYFDAEEAARNVRWDRTAGAALKEKGWKGDEPDFIREFLGKWCQQDARFVYPVHSCNPNDLLYATERPRTSDKVEKGKEPVVISNYADHINPVTGAPAMWFDVDKAISDLPKRKRFNQRRQWMFAIGVDFGYSPDPMAIVVWAFANDTQDVYELFSWKATKVHTDDQGRYLLKVWSELDSVVVFVGDPAGKQDDFEVWRTRMQLPIDEANKKGKNTLEEFLADDIRRGRIHLRRESPLHDEMKHLVYLPIKPGKTRDVAKHRRAGDGIIHGDHCCDAARYAYASLSHYLSKAPQEAADKGTRAALIEEEARIEKRLDERETRRAARLADGDEDYLESLGEEVF
jgi:hypothetical protein